MMWGDRDEIRYCGLSKVWNNGEGYDLHDLWLVMLESSKDRVLGVDTSGQHVPPRVRYEMACLLIMDVVGSVPYSEEWKISVVTRLGSYGAKRVVVPRTTLGKPDVRPIVKLCNDM
jgi:hypothetical protein